MKKLSFFLAVIAIFALFGSSLKADEIIIVQSGSSASFYTGFKSAIDAAPDGATIYLPPGDLYVDGNTVIDKELHIIGSGHNPYTSTWRTVLSGNGFNIATNGEGGSLTGVYVDNDIYIGISYDNDSPDGYTFSRCSLNHLYLGYNSDSSPDARHITVSECVIRESIYGRGATNCLFTKCFIGDRIEDLDDCTITNCAFIDNYYSATINDVDNSAIKNSIIIRDAETATVIDNNCRNNVFHNNIFVADISFPFGDSNSGYDNIVSVPSNTIFMQGSIGSGNNDYHYSYDYRLKDDSDGKNAGDDGYDIGPYGTANPYKDTPYIPQIIQYGFSNETDENHELHIDMEIEAQQK